MFKVFQQDGGFIRLFIAERLVHGTASALMGIFLPIFLFTVLNENFLAVGAFYTIISIAYIFLLVPCMQIMNHIGFRNALILSGGFSVITFTLLYFSNAENIKLTILGIIPTLLLFRIFHWVPYHVSFTVFTRTGHRGSSVGLTYATIALMAVAGPLIAGYIISSFGYDTLFFVVTVLLVIATVSYGFVPNTNEKFTWTFAQTWRQLFSKKYGNTMLGFVALGAEATFSIIVWPIFLYITFSGNVLEIGAITALVAGITMALQLTLGYLLDTKKLNEIKTFQVGSILYAVGWIIKVFVLSVVEIFFVGLYHNVVKIFTQTPIETILYDMSSDQGRYVDEFTVLRETAVHIGRVLALAVIIVLSLHVSLQWTFIIGAIFALLINVIFRAQKEA